MIWGEEENIPETTTPHPPRSVSPAGEDWVLVGAQAPAPGDLGNLDPLCNTSSPPSSSSSEVGEDAEAAPAVTRGRHHAPPSRLDTLAAAEVKSSKSAQLVKQRNSGKSLSSKALTRSNKCLEVAKRGTTRANFPIRMAGNKNLKQC